MLHLYRRLLAARRGSPALQVGDPRLLDTPEGTLGWVRSADGDERTVLLNMGPGPVAISATGTVEVASDGLGEGEAFAGSLQGDAAVILRP